MSRPSPTAERVQRSGVREMVNLAMARPGTISLASAEADLRTGVGRLAGSHRRTGAGADLAATQIPFVAGTSVQR